MNVGELDVWVGNWRAQDALVILNRKIAWIFRQPVQTVIFRFVLRIDGRNPAEERDLAKRREMIYGDCDRGHGVIRLVICPQWRSTAIHELVHMYKADMPERAVKKVSRDVIRYLKSLPVGQEV